MRALVTFWRRTIFLAAWSLLLVALVGCEARPTISVAPSGAGSPSNDTVTIYVRVDGSTPEWFAISVEGQLADTFGFLPGTTGVGCHAMPVDASLVMLGPSPLPSGATSAIELYTREAESTPPIFWVAIGSDSSVTQGTGVPPWWGPSPQIC